MSTPPPTPLRILIVDDHVDSTRALDRLFRSEGHVVVAAHTLTGAMALVVGQHPIDVLVSDIALPDGDGCELLRRLRAFYGGRDVAAVALTGRGEESWVEDCRAAGYRRFLVKPVMFQQILDAVREVKAEAVRGTVPPGPMGLPATAAAPAQAAHE
jgi:CheY-like chemotaxis protein